MIRDCLTASLCTLLSLGVVPLAACGGDDDDDGSGAAIDAGDDDAPDAGDDGEVDAGADSVTQTATFSLIGAGTELAGSSGTLIRTPEGLEADITVTELTAGNVYTMWWVIYQNPELCIQGEGNPEAPSLCGAPLDLPVMGSDPDHVTEVQGAFVYAIPAPDGGEAADETGTVTLTRTYAANTDPENGIYYPAGSAPPVGYWDGLVDPMTAEVHIAVRDHGPEGNSGVDVEEQRSVFNSANCGAPPLYMCATYAAAIFPAAEE